MNRFSAKGILVIVSWLFLEGFLEPRKWRLYIDVICNRRLCERGKCERSESSLSSFFPVNVSILA